VQIYRWTSLFFSPGFAIIDINYRGFKLIVGVGLGLSNALFVLRSFIATNSTQLSLIWSELRKLTKTEFSSRVELSLSL